MKQSLNRALRSIRGLKLEFTDEKTEENYWNLKRENLIKDFKVFLEFLMLFNIWITVTSAINKTWIEVYIGVSTAALLFIVYFFRSSLIRYNQIITLGIIISYTISRLFLFKMLFVHADKGSVFHVGYTLSSMHGVLLYRLLKVSHKSLGLITLLALRYLIMTLYIEPGIFFWPLFVRHCFVDAFIMYTFYYQESTFRTIYQGFTQKKEELLKFKELLAESLPQGLIVVTCKCNTLLFSNKTFQSTFDLSGDPNLLKTYLRSLTVDQSSIRETVINHPLTVKSSPDYPLSLVEILEKFDSDTNLGSKTISLAASTVESEGKKLFEVTLKKVKWDCEDAIAVLFNDITYQENLIALKMANINKDKVIATVSHELRTPLNGIIGILDITKRKAENPEIQEYLSLCKDNAHLLLSLVNSILDLQQISSGKLKLNPTTIDVHKVFNSVLQLFYFQCKEKNISLECDIHEDIPVTIFTDENRLKQILINLLGNAIKFTSKGFVKLEINSSRENPDSLQISVSDTGIGIKQEDQKRLFRMYSRIEDGESVNKNGVGLGLTISNALVELLNGGKDSHGISVDSEYRSGSRFSFEILRNLKEKKHEDDVQNQALLETKPYINHTQTESENSRAIFIQNTLNTDANEQKREEDGLLFDSASPHDFNEFFAPSNLNLKLSSYSSVRRINTSSNFRQTTEKSQLQDLSLSDRKSRRGTPTRSYSIKKHVSAPDTVQPHLNILFVDDNPFNLLVAKNLMQEFRYNITTALGGQEAIDITKKSLSEGIIFKIIFMDCQMPIMDGFETTKILLGMMKNGEIPEIPIYGWTANNSEEDVKRCFEVGMIGHLPKPASKSDFSNVLTQLGYVSDTI